MENFENLTIKELEIILDEQLILYEQLNKTNNENINSLNSFIYNKLIYYYFHKNILDLHKDFNVNININTERYINFEIKHICGKNFSFAYDITNSTLNYPSITIDRSNSFGLIVIGVLNSVIQMFHKDEELKEIKEIFIDKTSKIKEFQIFCYNIHNIKETIKAKKELVYNENFIKELSNGIELKHFDIRGFSSFGGDNKNIKINQINSDYIEVVISKPGNKDIISKFSTIDEIIQKYRDIIESDKFYSEILDNNQSEIIININQSEHYADQFHYNRIIPYYIKDNKILIKRINNELFVELFTKDGVSKLFNLLKEGYLITKIKNIYNGHNR